MITNLNQNGNNYTPVTEEDIRSFLEDAIYPATKRELLDYAIDYGAPDHILEFLNRMPDHEYESFNNLIHSLGISRDSGITI